MKHTSLRDVLASLPPPNDRVGLERVAVGADVPYHTILKIAKGETTDPRLSTFEKLARYLRKPKKNTVVRATKTSCGRLI